MLFMKNLLFVILSFFTLSVYSQCVISDLQIERTICNEEGLFDVSINFNFSGQGNSGFRVQGNGINHGEFAYVDLPIVISGLEANCFTAWEFVARDIDNPDCSAGTDLGTVCCIGDCAVEILDFELGECINGGFDLTFNAESVMSGGLAANVFLNGNQIATVNYDNLPVTLEDVVGMDDIENEFVICDIDNPTCCDSLMFESPCACSIKNIRSRIVNCNAEDSTYSLLVNFDTNMVSDSFQVGTPGNFLGVFAYEDLPLAVGPGFYDMDITYYLFVDQKNTFCFSELAVQPLELCDTICVFSDVQATLSTCEDEEFYATLTFETNNPGVLGFTIQGNGKVYGEDYQYGMESYTVGPLRGDCETIYEFVLIDNQLEDCQGSVSLEEPLCCLNCSITELVVEPVCLEDKVDSLFVDFLHEYSVDSMFVVMINDSVYGPYHSNELPLTLDVDLPAKEEIRILVEDTQDAGCRKFRELVPECGPAPCPEYFDIKGEFGDCLEDSTFMMFLSFKVEGGTSDSFTIAVGDQLFGPFAYGQMVYEIGPLESNCESTIIKFIDGEWLDCAQVHVFDEIKCCEDNCEFGEVNLEVKCEEGVMVGFFINAFPAGELFTKYTVELGDNLYGPFNYEEVNLIETSLANGDFVLVLRDIEFPDCVKEVKLGVDCSPFPCSLQNLQVETVNCTEETFMFLINVSFDFPSTDLFQVFINGELLGTSSYSLLPVLTAPLQRGNGPWHILVKHFERPDCATDVLIEEEVCESSVVEEFENLNVYMDGGDILFEKDNDLMFKVTMFDLLGRVTAQFQWNSSNLVLPVQAMMRGMSFIRIEYNNQIVTRRLFIP
jgi:hypothetical protein